MWEVIANAKGEEEFLKRGQVDPECYGGCAAEVAACAADEECRGLFADDSDADVTHFQTDSGKDAIFDLARCAAKRGCFSDAKLLSAGGVGKCKRGRVGPEPRYANPAWDPAFVTAITTTAAKAGRTTNASSAPPANTLTTRPAPTMTGPKPSSKTMTITVPFDVEDILEKEKSYV